MDARDSSPAEQQIRELAQQLLASGIDKLADRESRIITALARRTQVTRDIDQSFDSGRSFGGRLADRVASFGGSWTFIVGFIVILLAWVAFNGVILVGGVAFDRYPFVFLNLILSMLAALQAPIIMMSQNRQGKRDRLAAGMDYEINLKSEIEIMALHEKIDQIRDTHLAELLSKQQEQLQLLMHMTQAKIA